MTDTLMGRSPPEPAGAGAAEERELSPAVLVAGEDLFGGPGGGNRADLPGRPSLLGGHVVGPDGLVLVGRVQARSLLDLLTEGVDLALRTRDVMCRCAGEVPRVRQNVVQNPAAGSAR